MNPFERLSRLIIASDAQHLPIDLPVDIADRLDPPIVQTINDWLQNRLPASSADALSFPQQAMIGIWRSIWIAVSLSCEPTNRLAAEEAIALLYRDAGLVRPRSVNWVRSPTEGFEVANQLIKQKVKSSRNKVWNVPGRYAYKIIERGIARTVREMIVSEVLSPVRSQGWGRVGSQIEIALLTKRASNAHRLFLRAAYGNQDSHWLAQCSFFYIICNMDSLRSLRGLFRLALDCWWWWPFETHVVISEKPIELTVDDKSLTHIQFADGTGLDL